MEDRCIVCGEIIPEGTHICKNCESNAKGRTVVQAVFDDVKRQNAKADSGKPNLSLVPKEIIYEMERYHEALLRHTLAIWNDVQAKDKESGLLHLSHIAVNVAFLLEMIKDKE